MDYGPTCENGLFWAHSICSNLYMAVNCTFAHYN